MGVEPPYRDKLLENRFKVLIAAVMKRIYGFLALYDLMSI